MDQIIDMAERLGKAIAGSPQAAAVQAARKALDDQPQIAQALKDYQEQTEKIARLQSEQKPVEVEDKHKLREIEDRLLSSEVFKKYTAAQVEYVDLMRKVNEALQSLLGETEGD